MQEWWCDSKLPMCASLALLPQRCRWSPPPTHRLGRQSGNSTNMVLHAHHCSCHARFHPVRTYQSSLRQRVRPPQRLSHALVLIAPNPSQSVQEAPYEDRWWCRWFRFPSQHLLRSHRALRPNTISASTTRTPMSHRAPAQHLYVWWLTSQHLDVVGSNE